MGSKNAKQPPFNVEEDTIFGRVIMFILFRSASKNVYTGIKFLKLRYKNRRFFAQMPDFYRVFRPMGCFASSRPGFECRSLYERKALKEKALIYVECQGKIGAFKFKKPVMVTHFANLATS